ncbi:MAG: DUF192 domain-containing protein [Nanoarchaeota archaeon]|nr:DUF192 domain-containing protein [Nanoarchaeota archaeon]
MKKISFSRRGKKFSLSCRECGFFSFGLMFRTRETKPCVFKFGEPTKFKISSLFVFFPFLAVWLDGKNEVIEIRRINPFNLFVPFERSYATLVEIPLNKKNSGIVDSLVGD